MKTAILPSIRVEPEIRAQLESVLGAGETLSSFIEGAARREANFRKVNSEFLERARASLANARATGKTVPASAVIAELNDIIDARFGSGSSRQRSAI